MTRPSPASLTEINWVNPKKNLLRCPRLKMGDVQVGSKYHVMSNVRRNSALPIVRPSVHQTRSLSISTFPHVTSLHYTTSDRSSNESSRRQIITIPPSVAYWSLGTPYNVRDRPQTKPRNRPLVWGNIPSCCALNPALNA